GLHAEGIDDEDESAPALVVGVEVDLDVVVRRDAVAVGERRPNGTMRLEGADPEMDRRRGVPDKHLGGVVAGTLVHGLVGGKAGEDRGGAPGRFVEVAVDGRASVGGGCRDGKLAEAPVINGASGYRSRGEGGAELKGCEEGKHRGGGI